MRFFVVSAFTVAFLSSSVLSVPVEYSRDDSARALLSRQNQPFQARELYQLFQRADGDESGAIDWAKIGSAASHVLTGVGLGSAIGGLFHHGDNKQQRDYDDQLMARDDLFELLARDDFDSEAAINLKPIINGAKKLWEKIKPGAPLVGGAAAGLGGAIVSGGGNHTRRDYVELGARGDDLFELLARDLDESGALNLKPIINGAKALWEKIKPGAPLIGGGAIGLGSALLSGGGNHSRRDFHELIARLDEQQQRRDAFEFIARAVMNEALLDRRALTEREVDLD